MLLFFLIDRYSWLRYAEYMSARVIIATGISGSNRKEYLDRFERYSATLGKKVKVYHVGQLMIERAQRDGLNITTKNILNTNKHTMQALRSGVYESILRNLKDDHKNYDAIIVSIHGFFYWKKTFHHSYDHHYIARFKPDLFVTIMRDPVDVHKTLTEREQWKRERLTISEIALWQNVETEVLATWAELSQCPYYAFYDLQRICTLYKLAFIPDMESTYISMPMTHMMDGPNRAKIERFIKKLEEHFVVFVPMITKGKLPEVNQALSKKTHGEYMTSYQTVKIDLDILLHQADRIIVFFPKPVGSPGVVNELREAHETNKEAWIIYPSKLVSPFLIYYYDRSFLNEKQFFTFLDGEQKGTIRFTHKLD